MRRIPLFLENRAVLWREWGRGSQMLTIPGGPGHSAYALRQAALRDKMAERFIRMWSPASAQVNDFLLSHNIPAELELRILQEEPEESLAAAQSSSRAAEAGPGQDEDDEDQWGVSAPV